MSAHSLPRYIKKSFLRALLSRRIAPLVRWQPLANPEPGYTAIIGCNRELTGLLLANLRMLGDQRHTNLREVLLVIDGTPAEVGFDVAQRAKTLAPRLPVRVLHYNDHQRELSRKLDWPWVYSWLSWSIGIANTTTQHAMLHDLDALLLNPNVFEHHYEQIRARNVQYLGISWYDGLGVIESDRLARTFELMFDAQFVRQHFRPIELFNKMYSLGGRRVEFDTFLYAQLRKGTRDIIPLPAEDMVHPSQMVTHYVEYRNRRHRVPDNNNILMIPYYNHVGGDPSLVLDITAQLRAGSHAAIKLWNSTLDVTRISPVHRAWLKKQSLRVENAISPQGPRPDVLAYFNAIEAAPVTVAAATNA